MLENNEMMVVMQMKMVDEPLPTNHCETHCADKQYRCVHLKHLPLMPWKTYCVEYNEILHNGYRSAERYYSRDKGITFRPEILWYAIEDYQVLRLPDCDKQELIQVNQNIPFHYEEA